MKKQAIIIDYGSGNLLSIMRAVKASGAEARLTGDPVEVSNASHLIIPGVGAFAECMARMKRKNLIDPLFECINKGAKILGICVGMQILFDESEEFGTHQGLGIISGKVVPVPAVGPDGKRYKIPHIGWSPLQRPVNINWNGTILDTVEDGCSCYFVHSFMAVPDDEMKRLADTYYYGEIRICAAVHSGNIFGCQFHPEKSGEVGLSILLQFLKL